MRSTMSLLLGSGLFCLFLFVGSCADDEGGPSGPGDDPGAAQAKVDQANALLEDVLFDLINGDDPEVPGDIDLSGPYNLYVEALGLDSDHVGANFGAGILEVVMLTQDPEVQDFFDDVKELIDADQFFEVEPGGRFFGSPVAMSGPVFELKELHLPLMTSVRMNQGLCRMPSDGDPTVDDLQEICLSEILPRISIAVQRLTLVTGDETFVFTVTPRMQGDPGEDAVELDLTEVYATLASLNSVRAILLHFCAYNLSLDAYTGEEMLEALTPGSPFAALHPEGGSRMVSARQSWVDALSNLDAGIDFLESETDYQGDDLIRIDPYDGITQADLDSVKHYLPKAQNLLNSSEVFTADWDGKSSTPKVSLEFSLNSFYRSPVTDMKGLLPDYTPALDVQHYTSWEYEDTLAHAEVNVASAGWYYWYREANYYNGVPGYYWEDSNISVPEWASAWISYVHKASDAPYANLGAHFSGWLEPGLHTVECELWIDYEVPHSRYVPRITWEANSFDEWIFPDPTMGGLLPGMTDQLFKETFGIEGSGWEKTTTFHLW